MKPRIYMFNGMWRCRSTLTNGLIAKGVGRSPADAYVDWSQWATMPQ